MNKEKQDKTIQAIKKLQGHVKCEDSRDGYCEVCKHKGYHIRKFNCDGYCSGRPSRCS